MRYLTIVLVLTLSLPAAGQRASHPHNSIAPEPPRPTPYGLDIVRISSLPRIAVKEDTPLLDPLSEQHQRSVDLLQASRGPYSPTLIEPLSELGRAYQHTGRHRPAIDAFKRALHLIRVNRGLYSEDQLSLMEHLLVSQLALGQVAMADAGHDYLYRVQRKLYQPGSEAMSEAAMAYGDWKRKAFLDGFGDATYRHLLKIHKLHSGMIDEIQAGNADDLAQVPHLYERMRAEYLISRYEREQGPVVQLNISQSGLNAMPSSTQEELEFHRLKKNNYRTGRRTMERIVTLLERQDPTNVQALVEAGIAQGDWYAWWGQTALARQCYERAYALGSEDGSPATDPASLFAEPVELPGEPVFQPGPMTPPANNQARAVVRFDVSELGEARDIKYIELEAERADDARLVLYRMLRSVRFRPILREGTVARAHAIVREYNFQY
ncbi:tetratricopeptide repeat protein [Haliea sp. E1-2-M8]|uniref:tetratricopeptide repeat protein n=1 Tax=Haliea sp. E1-2-M8 TaxID=3064706 RepID=UPI002719A2FD|nr:tetratricopeptide repeat protein [Haliea sp. E1-2-M8]MDO8862995.1 tetratricopeptide repeat protein [Haliea sp. E1-2-M8]